MKVALIEDELPALEHLEFLLAEVAPEAEVVARIRTVRRAREWLAAQHPVDLILADIQLGDGLSLDAFAEVERDVPIVFTTAFDHHLAPALAGNGIAYLLKPIQARALGAAVDKHRRLERHFVGGLASLARAVRGAEEPEKPQLMRLVGRLGLDYVGIPIEEIAWVHVRTGMTLCVTRDGRELLLDGSLGALEGQLDPRCFHRINRWMLAHIDAIVRVRRTGRGRLGLELRPEAPAAVEVPQERAANFKRWYGIDAG